MPSSALANMSASPMLEQLSGQEKGQIFELKADRVTIGRHDNNDIVIVGEAVSRYHACVERSGDGGFWVRDQQSKNGVQVNGNTVNESPLRDGDTVQIGAFLFRFRAPIGSDLPEEGGAGEEAGIYAPPTSTSAPRSKRPLVYGAVGVLLLFLYLNNNSSTSPPKPKAAGGESAAGELPALPEPTLPPALPNPESNKVAGLEDPLLKGEGEDGRQKRTLELKEAEQYFRKGLREYTSENYHRAIELLRTALTLNRQHELANYYLGLSYFELERQANKNYEIGRKYFEALNYSRAIYHFQEVVNLLQHRPTDKRIKDAEKFIAQAKKRLQEAQQFP